uniref:Uncharacterized protein n=1 Tax=Streptomyces sp. NBC_01393 TaxID=2903851 RepID=A0AAU3IAV9_9ACTN
MRPELSAQRGRAPLAPDPLRHRGRGEGSPSWIGVRTAGPLVRQGQEGTGVRLALLGAQEGS